MSAITALHRTGTADATRRLEAAPVRARTHVCVLRRSCRKLVPQPPRAPSIYRRQHNRLLSPLPSIAGIGSELTRAHSRFAYVFHCQLPQGGKRVTAGSTRPATCKAFPRPCSSTPSEAVRPLPFVAFRSRFDLLKRVGGARARTTNVTTNGATAVLVFVTIWLSPLLVVSRMLVIARPVRILGLSQRPLHCPGPPRGCRKHCRAVNSLPPSLFSVGRETTDKRI